MRILVVSDSHGNNSALDSLAIDYPNMDLYLHAGDSESSEYSIAPFRSVRGNCDYFSNFPDHLLIPFSKGNIWIQHHPMLSTKILKENNVKIFLYGHTHVRRLEEKDGILYINPGAISFPRDGFEGSYLLIDIIDKEIRTVFKTIE